jgi:transcriptional regulator with XRE-family HTH domain
MFIIKEVIRVSAVAKRLDSIRERGGISGREVAQLLRTTPQTVSRWQQGKVSPHPATLDRLLKLDWLADQLAAFYEPDEARLWLFSPHIELGGKRPADLIAEDRMEEVLAVIDRLQSGAYV